MSGSPCQGPGTGLPPPISNVMPSTPPYGLGLAATRAVVSKPTDTAGQITWGALATDRHPVPDLTYKANRCAASFAAGDTVVTDTRIRHQGRVRRRTRSDPHPRGDPPHPVADRRAHHRHARRDRARVRAVRSARTQLHPSLTRRRRSAALPPWRARWPARRRHPAIAGPAGSESSSSTTICCERPRR